MPLASTPLPTPPASVAAALGLGLGRGSSGSVGASSGAATSMGAASAGAASSWTWPSMGATSPTAGGRLRVSGIVAQPQGMGALAVESRALVTVVRRKPESTERRLWGQSLKKPEGAPLNLGEWF